MTDFDPVGYLRQSDGGSEIPAGVDPLDALLEQRKRQRASTQLLQSPDPETVAKANALARESGLPVNVVESDIASVQKRQAVDRFMRLGGKYPVIANWGNEDRNAALAVDDYDNLSVLGKLWYGAKNTGSSLKAGLLVGTSGLYGVAETMARNAEAYSPIEWAQRRLFGNSVEGLIGDFAARQRKAGQAMATAARPKVSGFVARNLLTGVESTPVTALGVGAAMMTGSPATGAMIMGGSVAGSESTRALDAGKSPLAATVYGGSQGVIEYATEILPASKLLADLAAKSPFATMFFHQIFREVPGEQVATVLQDLNEWAVLNPDKPFMDYVKARPGAAAETLIATLGGLGATTVVTRGAQVAADATGKAINRVAASRKAQQEGEFLDKLATAAQESKTRGRDPQAFESLVAALSAGTSAENIYIPAGKVREYLQSSDWDSVEFWQEYDQDIADGTISNGDVVVPISKAVAHLSGTPAWEALKGDMRLSPGGQSLNEAQETENTLPDEMNRLSDEVSQQLEADRKEAEPRQKLFDAALRKLHEAGQTLSEATKVATLVANRYATRAARLGREVTGNEFDHVQVNQVLPAGLVPFVARDPGKPLSEALKPVVAAMRGKKAVRSEKARSGPSLIDFIRSKGGIDDPGGDLDAIGFAKLKSVSKKGQTKLIRKSRGDTLATGGPGLLGSDGQVNSNSPDELAMRAWEAGYFPEFSERPSVNDLLDALAEGNSGRHRYAAGNENVTDDDQLRMAAQDLYQLLDQAGLDPGTASDKDIATAIQRYQEQAARGQSFDQVDPKSAAFKKWFGDSKVVDENGDPLVVYHGTRKGGFDRFDTSGKGKTDGTGAFFTASVSGAMTYSNTKRIIDAAPDAMEIAADPEKFGWKAEEEDGGWAVTDPSGYVHWSEDREQAFVEGAKEIADEAKDGNYAVYLSLQNPLIVDFNGANWDSRGGEEWFVEDENGDGLEYFTNEDDLNEFVDNWDEEANGPLKIIKSNDNPNRESTDDIARQAREDGYDGVIFENITDEGPYGQGYGWDTRVYVAFSPTQIKSVFNRGTFDPNDERILYQDLFDANSPDLDPTEREKAKERLRLRAAMPLTGKIKGGQETGKAQDASMPEGLFGGPAQRSLFQSSFNTGQFDLFSHDGSYEPEISSARGGPSGRQDGADAARSISRNDAPGSFAQRTEIVQENTRQLGVSKVSSVEDAAKAMSYLGRGAVERFDALVTDKDGKPLAIVGAFKGALSEAPAYVSTVVGEAFRINGAANIWFAHNHPSGILELSDADRKMQSLLAESFRGSEIKAHGIFAIGGSAQDSRGWVYGDSEKANDVKGLALPDGKATKVPVVERVYTQTEKLGPQISNFGILHEAAPKISGGEAGIVLTNTSNEPVAFVPVNTSEIDKLRDGGRMDALYRSISVANAGAAFIVDDGTMSTKAGINLAGLLNSLDVKVHDIVTVKDGKVTESWRSKSRGNIDARQFDQSYSDGPRGRVTFDNGMAVIDLFQQRDLSTFIHEMGHVWLEELQADASRPDAPQQLRDDWQAVQDWLAANGHAVVDGVIPVDGHELWARGIERYTMEGKAPSSALRKVFDAFRSWMLSIYQMADNLRAPITPEIRSVMDRLIATDQEIEDARAEQNLKALFDSVEAAAKFGMSEAAYNDYSKAATEAKDEAFDRLLFKTMEAVRRERTKAYQDERDAVEADVRASVDARPVFRALAAIRTKDGPKLDKQWLIDTYGEDVLASLPKSVPPIFKANGTDADIIAEASGFATGDEMVKALIGVEDRRAALREGGDKRSARDSIIDEETDAIMKERHGDPLSDGSIEEEALALIHNEKQGELQAIELRVLSSKTKAETRPTPYRIARLWAAEKIRTGQVKDVASRAAIQRYLRAASKAGKAAEQAYMAGDTDEAFKQKQAQMLNNALVAEAKQAADAIDVAVARMSRYAKRRTIKSMDQDYLERIHDLLERVDLKQRSQASIDRQGSFEAWRAEQEAKGHEIVTPESFLGAIGTTHWTRLSVENLLGLDETVKQIAHLGRYKQELIDNKVKREFDAVVAEAQLTVGMLPPKPPSDLMEPSRWDAIKSRVASMDASLLKMETVFDWLDGGNSNGVFNRIVFRPIADAQDREKVMLTDYTGRLTDLLKAVPKEQLKRWSEKVSLPELLNRETGNPWVMTRDQLVSMALNMGNEGNIQRLVDGYGWNEDAVRRVLNRELTAADWQYVQGVWDTIDSLWPEIAAMERRVNGVEPDKVEAVPVVTEHGTLRGGYFPAVYDPRKSVEAEAHAAKAGDIFENTYTKATTRASSTKERANVVKRPIYLSLGVINRHVGEVIHDITHREAVMQADKFLSSKRIMKAVDETLGPEVRRQFRPWLQHIANEWALDRKGVAGWDAFAKKLRTNTSIVGMGFRLSTIVMQVAGYSNSFERVGAKWVAPMLAKAVDPRVYRFVMERSSEVRNRMDTLERDVRENVKQLAGRTDILANARKFAFYGIGYMDRVVVIPTWLGAYNRAISEGMSEVDAGYYADKAVRQSQGAGAAKDLAAVQRSNEWMRLATMFYSYQSAVYQRFRSLARDARTAGVRDVPDLIARSFWLIVVPPLLSELLAGRGPDDDEDWGMWAFQKMLAGLFGPIPIARDVVNAAQSGFGYSFTPAARAFETGLNVKTDAGNIIEGDDTKRATRNVIELTGYTLGLPVGQLAAAAQFIVDVSEGEQDPEGIGDWYTGLTKGKIDDN